MGALPAGVAAVGVFCSGWSAGATEQPITGLWACAFPSCDERSGCSCDGTTCAPRPRDRPSPGAAHAHVHILFCVCLSPASSRWQRARHVPHHPAMTSTVPTMRRCTVQ